MTPFETDGRTVTEADIVNFAGFSGDFGPYHLDHTAAGAGLFGAPVLHGLGTLAICSGLLVQSRYLRSNGSDPIAFLGVDVRMARPTLVGDTVRVRVADVAQRPSASRPGCYVCLLHLECVDQRSAVKLVVNWASLQRGALLPLQPGSAEGTSHG
ncbi:MaoC/PaaZ C-terminal domain-containing protein [Plantactinospora sp. KBS50]|uniref:MaoC/PaaZ C-terminal domain-containing protein n=1 Tax=Plantactinospora sp. KBS50 TaxID=2024580 RepID=UPI0012FD9BBB|nr:MaoC/PaaZ C-terminal domain-containing protein [Plantactinospora sp. KBS50]